MNLRLLLDSHTLIWWFTGDRRLSLAAREAIAEIDNDKFVSAASAWEIATKHRLGKLPLVVDLVNDFRGQMSRQSFDELPISVADGLRAGSLPGPLRDPFDRILIAQAMSEDLVLISNETVFDGYGVRRIW